MTTTTPIAPPELTATQGKTLAALQANPGATAAEIATAAGIGGSTAGKALAVLEQGDLARREQGGRNGGRRTADRWWVRTPEPEVTTPASVAPEAPISAPEPEASDPATAEAQASTPAPASRLARGALRGLVLAHLQAHPGQEFTAPAIAKALQRSSGAVANALAKLTDQGTARHVGTTPRTYRTA
jgi:predicted transcriptional regulator